MATPAVDRTSFGYSTHADEVLSGISLEGKVALVTGGNQGIGLETARSLAKAGASVYIACRDPAKAAEAVKDILDSSKVDKSKVDSLELDLASFDSIRAFGKAWNAKELPLNILINNAGVMAMPPTLTKDGFEMQYGVNHLGHFLMTSLIFESLKKGQPARIVNVSSVGHNASEVNFDVAGTLKIYETSWWNPVPARYIAYGQSKAANILFSVELNKRFKAAGLDITANAVHPGNIYTALYRHEAESFVGTLEKWFLTTTGKDTQQGASTQVWAATAPELKGIGGKYLSNCGISSMVRGYATDETNSAKLWELSVKQCGAKWDL